jgi:hypothetical protein
MSGTKLSTISEEARPRLLTASCGQAESLRFAYILSPSYSGSTLLTFLLGAHPSVSTIGELKASALGNLDTYVCSCGTPILECAFWEDVRQRMADQGIPFDVRDFGTHFRWRNRPLADRLLRARVRGSSFEALRSWGLRSMPGLQRYHNDVLQRNRALVAAVLDTQGGEVFLDGSKDPNRLYYFLRADFWKIKVIYLIRDGRGAANSFMKHYSAPMSVAAKEWRRTHEECDRVAAALPAEQCVRLHYEELCRNPEHVLEQLFQFLEVAPDAASTEIAAQEQHVLGNAMRLRSTNQIQLDEKWRRELTPADLAEFDRGAGALNRSYGYKD